MYIFAGSYERFIFGFSATGDCSQPQEIVKRYTFAAHKNGVKCLVAAGPYVASGGADDLIHLYDMKAERDLGVLMNPGDGAVPCLEFYTPEGRSAPSHMLSGSADGGISIWRCRDWEHLKMMRGHKGAVNSIAVHRSGKLALSTARDGAIRMWNLAKGRCTYTSKLEAEAEQVAFSTSGDSYSLLCGNRITVHSTSGEGGLQAALTAPRRITSTAAQCDQLMLLGLEDGSVRVWDVRTSGLVGGWERAHGSRVRGMAIMQQGGGMLPASLATASSDGTIKLWDTRRLGGGSSGGAGGDGTAVAVTAPSATCTAQVSTNARLTCLAAVDPAAAAAPSRVKPATAAAATAAGGGGGDAKKAKAAKGAATAAAAAAAAAEKGGKAKQQQQQRRPEGKEGGNKAKPPQQPQQQQRKQQQQQQQQLKRGGPMGRGKANAYDDPGFEIVPASRDDADDGKKAGARRGKSGADEEGEKAGPRQAVKEQGKTGRKRQARDDDGEEGAAEEPGRLGGGGGSGKAGPSGRQQGQGQLGQEKGKGQKSGPAFGVKGQGQERGAQQQQRPAKKLKTGGGAGAEGGKGGGGKGPGGRNGMAGGAAGKGPGGARGSPKAAGGDGFKGKGPKMQKGRM